MYWIYLLMFDMFPSIDTHQYHVCNCTGESWLRLDVGDVTKDSAPGRHVAGGATQVESGDNALSNDTEHSSWTNSIP